MARVSYVDAGLVAALRGTLGEREFVELTCCIGHCNGVARVIVSLGIDPEVRTQD